MSTWIRLVLFFSPFCLFCASLAADEKVILSIGEPMIDLIYHVEDALLTSLHFEKGGSQKVDFPSFENLLLQLTSRTHKVVPGGSSANTLKGLAKLGHSCRYQGKIGSDPMGECFAKGLEKYGIEGRLFLSETHTTQLLSLVTPDGERTMRCCFGASNELKEDDISLNDFANVSHVHIEGYMLYYERVLLRIFQLAKHIGATVSMDLASFEVVKKFRDRLAPLLAKYVDIVIGNEDEAKTLTGLEPKDACLEMQRICPIAVVLVGENGCIVGSGGKVFSSETQPVDVVDTTGAGDLFASGFLHGFLTGQPLETCASFGNLTGSTCVGEVGAEISSEKWETLHLLMHP